jgi:3-hydroxyisobutyrate dehydrogenase
MGIQGESTMTKETIGFIGIGTMGWEMAAHLARAGHEVIAYDLDAARRERFAREFSTRQPAGLADLARASILITMLPNGAVVRQVLTEGGASSLAERLQPGSVLLDTTSSVPAGTRELGALLARRGVAMLDAPVSGGRIGAVQADLVFMLGGEDAAAIERVTPILAPMGKRVFRTGPLGSGHAMKAMNNFVSCAGFAAACEALIIGQRFGLDPAVMVDILNVSTGRNFSTERSMQRIVDRSYNGTFKLGLFTKDVKIAADMADEMGVAGPISHMAYQWMAEALERIGGEGDHTTAYAYWEKQSRGAAPPRM